MPEAWRVLEDPEKTGLTETLAPTAEPTGRPLWPLLMVAIAVVLAAAALLLTTGASDGALTVNAAHAAALRFVPPGSPAPSDGNVNPLSTASHAPVLVVEVNGAVRRPGVYRLAADARVADAIAAAGGYGARVDTAAAQVLNLAAKVTDGQQVRVPARGERRSAEAGVGAPATGGASASTTAAGGPVNVNSATAAQLEALPGIGPATAAKIIAARATRPFASVDELRERKVVGQATLQKIRALVTVN